MKVLRFMEFYYQHIRDNMGTHCIEICDFDSSRMETHNRKKFDELYYRVMKNLVRDSVKGIVVPGEFLDYFLGTYPHLIEEVRRFVVGSRPNILELNHKTKAYYSHLKFGNKFGMFGHEGSS